MSISRFFLVVIISISYYLPAQVSYKGFPEDKGYWFVEKDVFDGLADSAYTNLFYVNGDSTYNGLDYNVLSVIDDGKLIIENLGFIIKYYYEFDFNNEISSKRILFRNDSAAKMVYAKFPNQLNEVLWFDFNLQVGDTLNDSAYANYHLFDDYVCEPLTVESIDTVNIGGVDRNRYYLSNFWSRLALIEGIGFERNFRFNDVYCGMSPYPDHEAWEFYTEISGFSQKAGITNVENFAKQSIMVYPNPAQNFIMIQAENILKGNVKIFNVIGELVSVEKFQSGSPISISSLNSGVYIMQVFDGETFIGVQRILKK